MNLLFGPVTISATTHRYTATWSEKDGTFHRAFVPGEWNSWVQKNLLPRQAREKASCWIPWEMLREERNWLITVQEEVRDTQLFQALDTECLIEKATG